MGRLAALSRILGVLLVTAGLLAPAAARAQAVDPQKALAAQALYDQASAEMDEKKYASACRKLEEVTRLVPDGIGAKLTLGECYEALGKLASAWSQYALVEGMAARAGQTERAQRAAQKAATLKPRLATLKLEVPDAVRAIPGISILRDGVQVGDAQWGTPLPVDAGGHDVEVTAPGHQSWKKQVEVVADGAAVVVKIKPLKRLARTAAPPSAQVPGLPVTVLPPPADRSWQRPVGIASIVTGGVGLVGGAVLGGLAIWTNKKSTTDGYCDKWNTCDATGVALRSEAVAMGHGSTAAFIVGTAVLGGGVVLLVTAPPADDKEDRRKRRKAAGHAAGIGISPGGVRAMGAW